MLEILERDWHLKENRVQYVRNYVIQLYYSIYYDFLLSFKMEKHVDMLTCRKDKGH